MYTHLQHADEDVIDYVRLTLEAKLLQWSKEGLPEIPLLLRHNENHPQSRANNQFHSDLLDIWRLWHQEMDSLSLDYNIADLFQLMTEAESLEWDISDDNNLSSTKQQGEDHSFNLELMSQVSIKLKEMYPTVSDDEGIEDEDIDIAAIERLEREASRLSSQMRQNYIFKYRFISDFSNYFPKQN